MSKKHVSYKGHQNRILFEKRIITFSTASTKDATKPEPLASMTVELNKDAPQRIMHRYIQTILELEAKFQEKDATSMVFANVITERWQSYKLTSSMQPRSGIVTTNKLYKLINNKFTLEKTTVTDNMR